MEDENEDSSNTLVEKEPNAIDNNNIEGQENLNEFNSTSCIPERSTLEDEKRDGISYSDTTSLDDDLGNIVPWREKLKKSEEN